MAGKKTSPKLTGAFDLFGKSAEMVQRNINTFLILFILPFILAVIGSLANGNTNNFNDGGFSFFFGGSLFSFAFLLVIVAIIVNLFIQTMGFALQLEASTDKTPDLSHLFDVAKKYWLRVLGLLVVVGFMTVIGLILFIVPGLIVIRRYFLAPYVLIDKDVSIGEAMKQSADLSRPYSGWIWSIIGVLLLLTIPSIIPLVGRVVSLILVMFYSVAPAIRYQELKKLVKTSS